MDRRILRKKEGLLWRRYSRRHCHERKRSREEALSSEFRGASSLYAAEKCETWSKFACIACPSRTCERTARVHMLLLLLPTLRLRARPPTLCAVLRDYVLCSLCSLAVCLCTLCAVVSVLSGKLQGSFCWGQL